MYPNTESTQKTAVQPLLSPRRVPQYITKLLYYMLLYYSTNHISIFTTTLTTLKLLFEEYDTLSNIIYRM